MNSSCISCRVGMLMGLLTLGACSVNPDKFTLADLQYVEPELTEVQVTDSLKMAMAGYRAFLANTEANNKTPEAMRRLADLKIEEEFGTLVPRAVADPMAALGPQRPESADAVAQSEEPLEIISEDGASENSREAIETYARILADYPHYERNDQVLYQMARAHDELGETEEAMSVTDRLLREYPGSRYIAEISFRRGEYFFVRRKYLQAEHAYGAVIELGKESDFYELARYKLGWSLYKQELYEESLEHFLALLDHKLELGYEFATNRVVVEAAEMVESSDEERRVADTFRVVSFAFSNLGGAEVLNEYFGVNGRRAYENRVYRNLAEFYVEKLRFNDAAEVYQSFVRLDPLHAVAPHFSMRVTEIYAAAGFPLLVVESKKEFAQAYGLRAQYWLHHDVADLPEVTDFLKTNLSDLAGHYHALYQNEELGDDQLENYTEAKGWYEDYLSSFPDEDETAGMNFRLADLHLEYEAFDLAALAYERTAYEYPSHAESSAAGYAAIFSYREHLKGVGDVERRSVLRTTVDSSLRFATTFHQHEEAAKVLGAATDDLYSMELFAEAIAAGSQLVNTYPDAEVVLRRRAWTVVAHAQFETEAYSEAESGYLEVLGLLDDDDELRVEITENLAASIYQQGELALGVNEYSAAADHFLRIKQLAPTSSIRPSAEYDAAAALVSLAQWDRAADILNDLRAVHEGHELQVDVTKQLAFIYGEAGKFNQSADEYRRIADEAESVEQRSEALLLAGELYIKADAQDAALAVYGQYVDEFEDPFETNIEIRQTMADLLEPNNQKDYLLELGRIVELDSQAGDRRTDRTRFLAANAAFVLAVPDFDHFAGMTLSLPFDKSLAEKQARMNRALTAMEGLVQYEVADVTSAATFYMAEIYRNFSNALMESERPHGLSDTELAEYDMVIEEEAFPFEERALEVHIANMELMLTGTVNPWTEKSLGQLRHLQPARYNKRISSAGYLGAIDGYAYRSPLADALVAEAVAIDSIEGSPEGREFADAY